MGLCFSHCVTKQIKDIQDGRMVSSYLFGDVQIKVSTESVFEDCPFFYEEEKWHCEIAELNEKIFFDTNKFLNFYPNYKKDQVNSIQSYHFKCIMKKERTVETLE